jgi:hypothetical protein
MTLASLALKLKMPVHVVQALPCVSKHLWLDQEGVMHALPKPVV